MKIGDRVKIISFVSKHPGLVGTISKIYGDGSIKMNKLSYPIYGAGDVNDIWVTRSSYVRLVNTSKIIKVI